MQKFVSNRNITIASAKAAMAIKFVKGIPMNVPPAMYEEVMEKGIMPVTEAGAPLDPAKDNVIPEGKKVVLAPDDGAARAAAILIVIESMVRRNSPKDFTGAGHPNAQAVSAVLGWKADQKEVTDVWVKNKARVLSDLDEAA